MKTKKAPQGFSPEDLQQLIDLGVPKEAVVGFGLAPGQSGNAKTLYRFSYVSLMLLCFAPAVFLMTPAAARLLQALGFIPAEAILAHTGNPSSLLLIFAGIFLPGWILGRWEAFRSPEAVRRASVTTMVDMVDPAQSNAKLMGEILRWSIRKTNQRWKPGKDYLLSVHETWIHLAGWGAVWLYAAGLGLFAWEVSRITYVTPEKLVLRPMFGRETIERPWDTVVKLTTGCSTGHKGQKVLLYRVHFPDAFAYDIDHANLTPLRGTRLEALDAIDRQLREGNVPWERGKNVSGCFQHHAKKLAPAELERFERVYRLDGE